MKNEGSQASLLDSMKAESEGGTESQNTCDNMFDM